MIRKGDQIGPYTLLEKIGRGGFGVVWLAEKRASLVVTKVALKLANDDDIDLEAVRREASVWAQASGHPNVLSIIDADIYDDQVVIVSEYAPDGSLDKWLKKNNGKAPSILEAIEMASKILAGLEHLHSRKIIHRDLKPANILLQGSTPRLVDFGLARVMKATSNSRTVSGTYAYMPPETFEGNRSEQTDIWSVGVMLYEMLTGRLPYRQENDAALVASILQGKPEPLPDSISKSLREVVERAMERDLNKRFTSAAEMQKALHQAARFVNATEPFEAKTEILSSFADRSKADKLSQPTLVFGAEESPYKTNLIEQPETIAGNVGLDTADMTSGERQTDSQTQPSQEESLTIERVSDTAVKPRALKADIPGESGHEIIKIRDERKPSRRTGLYVGLGALALVLVLVCGVVLIWLVSSTLLLKSSDVLTSLSKEDVELLISDYPPETLKPLAESKEKREDLLKQLKELLTLSAEARATGIADRPEMKSQLALTKAIALSQAYMVKANNPDAITKAEIDTYLKKPGAEERFNSFFEEAKKNGQLPDGEMKEEQITSLKEQWAKVYVGEEKALKAGLDKERKTQLQIAIQQAQTLALKYNEEKIEKNKAAFEANDEEINKWISEHPEYDTKSRRAKAEELLRRALSGEDFAKLANENTDDPGNKDEKGELKGGVYEFGRGVMDKNFEEASFSLQPGQISDLVETPFGYHIIKLETKEMKKNAEGKEEEQVKVRHILISTMIKDESNPMGRDMPLKETAKQAVEKRKRENFVNELGVKHSISLPFDFNVVVPAITKQSPSKTPMPQLQEGGKRN